MSCATPTPSTSPPYEPPARVATRVEAPTSNDPVVARDGDFAVVVVRPGETYAGLAQRFLDDPGKGWWLSKFNQDEPLQPGALVTVPLHLRNVAGVYSNGYQTVSVLCYHRFGAKGSRLNVTAAAFEAQMDFLARNGYHVVSLNQLAGFLEGREPLPPKTVVITIDDGYKSTFEVAWPILRKFGFPATVYLYTDFVGAGDALSWAQMKDMSASGLIEIQPHSKTHANLTLRLPGETEARYRDRIRREVEAPISTLRDRVATTSFSYAYPYGDVNDYVTELLAKQKVGYGVTVTSGGNAFYAYPFMLRRTMIFGNEDIDAFKAKLTTFVRMGSR
ncbi:MAG: polysaccharide deacetylase family protein [Betaproteobacteria bacterium]